MKRIVPVYFSLFFLCACGKNLNHIYTLDSGQKGLAHGSVPTLQNLEATKNLASTDTIENSGAGFQVKSVELLKSSLVDCIGPDKTRLSFDMVSPAAIDTSPTYAILSQIVSVANGTLVKSDKKPFLLSSKSVDALNMIVAAEAENLPKEPKSTPMPALPPMPPSKDPLADAAKAAGLAAAKAAAKLAKDAITILNLLQNQTQKMPDILELEAENLVDTSRASRTGIAADGLSDGYLRSLGIIADVVAHNCDKSSNCLCETDEYARNMFRKCLPNINFKEAAPAILALRDACRISQREAISSLIRSYAFATAR